MKKLNVETEREELLNKKRIKLEKLETNYSKTISTISSLSHTASNLEKDIESNTIRKTQLAKEITKLNIKLTCLESSDTSDLDELIGKCFRVKHTSFFRIRQVVLSEWKYDNPSFKIERISYDAGRSNSSVKNENWKLNVLLDHISNSEEISDEMYNSNMSIVLERLGL